MLPAFKSVETQKDNSRESIEESSSDFKDAELFRSGHGVSPLETASSVGKKDQTFFSSGKQKLDSPLGGGCCSKPKAEDDQNPPLLQTTTPKQSSSVVTKENRAGSVTAAAPTTTSNVISPPQQTAALQRSSSEDKARAFLQRPPASENFKTEEASTSSGSPHTSASPSAAPRQPPKPEPWSKSERLGDELARNRRLVQAEVNRRRQKNLLNDDFLWRKDAVQWLRAKEVQSMIVPPVRKSLLGDTKPSDVRQATDFDDCYFQSSVSSLARRRKRLKCIVATKKVNEEGLYGFLLCKWGRWCAVIVNDYLPCDKQKKLLFSKTEHFWVALLHKAIAKLHGGYPALQRGYPDYALTMLTGSPCQRLPLVPLGDVVPAGKDAWPDVVSGVHAGNLMAASSGALHAYSLFRAQKDEANRRYLVLRDPYGVGSWARGSNGNSELVQRLEASFSRDDTFKIIWEDIRNRFTSITSCKPYDVSTFVWRMGGRFLGPYSSSLSAVHFIVTEYMEVDFALWRRVERGLELSQKFIFDGYFLIFRLERKLDGAFYLGDLEASAFRQAKTLLTLRCALKCGAYLVVCVSLQEWTRRTIHLQDPTLPAGTDLSRYELTMHSRKELWARHVPLADGSLADAVFKLVEKEGVKLDARPDALAATYSLTTYPAGVIFAAENRHPTEPIRVLCDASKSKSVTTTRGMKKTTDVVPPMHRQVLQAVVAVDIDSKLIADWPEPNPYTGFAYTSLLPLDVCNDPALEPEMESLHQPRPMPKLDKPDA